MPYSKSVNAKFWVGENASNSKLQAPKMSVLQSNPQMEAKLDSTIPEELAEHTVVELEKASDFAVCTVA